MRAALLAVALAPGLAAAQTDPELFAADNVIATLYHELGHAVVDLGLLPVFGQEEDAADSFSIVLIDAFYDEPDATELMDSVLDMWAVSAAEEMDDPAYWAAHDPSIRRRFSHICLFAGADLDGRGDWAIDRGLPEERLGECEEEFALAADSWGGVLDEMAGQGTMVFVPGGGADLASDITNDILEEEVAFLNDGLALPMPLDLRVEDCGEANAFYDPSVPEIVMCTEYTDWFLEIAPD